MGCLCCADDVSDVVSLAFGFGRFCIGFLFHREVHVRASLAVEVLRAAFARRELRSARGVLGFFFDEVPAFLRVQWRFVVFHFVN